MHLRPTKSTNKYSVSPGRLLYTSEHLCTDTFRWNGQVLLRDTTIPYYREVTWSPESPKTRTADIYGYLYNVDHPCSLGDHFKVALPTLPRWSFALTSVLLNLLRDPYQGDIFFEKPNRCSLKMHLLLVTKKEPKTIESFFIARYFLISVVKSNGNYQTYYNSTLKTVISPKGCHRTLPNPDCE